MKSSSLRRGASVALICVCAIACIAALEKGGKAFSKRNETPLLTEPSPLATPAGNVGFAEELAIEEVRGRWLRVKGKKISGWIFDGNVADEKPSQAPPAGLTTVSASDTDTVAAARPLDQAAKDYASRVGAGTASADLEWLDALASNLKAADVDAYLRENKKGEFQP